LKQQLKQLKPFLNVTNFTLHPFHLVLVTNIYWYNKYVMHIITNGVHVFLYTMGIQFKLVYV